MQMNFFHLFYGKKYLTGKINCLLILILYSLGCFFFFPRKWIFSSKCAILVAINFIPNYGPLSDVYRMPRVSDKYENKRDLGEEWNPHGEAKK